MIPATEQSWVAQAVTRSRHLSVQPASFQTPSAAQIPGFIADGTPADCASLGICELWPDRPDLLVSGINLGTNESLAFYLNSGTVGGARQGIVFGVRGIALSVKMPPDLFGKWRTMDLEALHALESDWQRISACAVAITERLLSHELWSGVDLYTVNLPWNVGPKTPVRLCYPMRVRYPSIFHPFAEGVFRHHLDDLIPVGEPPPVDARGRVLEGVVGDMDALNEGSVALMPVHYDLFPRDEDLLSSLRRAFN